KLVCLARLRLQAALTSQNQIELPTSKRPSSPVLKYWVSTSCSNTRGPPSTGRRPITIRLLAESRSKPNGLYGLSAEITIPSACGLPVPASGPRKIGSGAAWLVDSRRLYRALAYHCRLSLMSKRYCPNRPVRSDGVCSRLYWAKLKRSWSVKQW